MLLFQKNDDQKSLYSCFKCVCYKEINIFNDRKYWHEVTHRWYEPQKSQSSFSKSTNFQFYGGFYTIFSYLSSFFHHNVITMAITNAQHVRCYTVPSTRHGESLYCPFQPKNMKTNFHTRCFYLYPKTEWLSVTSVEIFTCCKYYTSREELQNNMNYKSYISLV